MWTIVVDLFAPRGQWGQFPSIADRIDASGDCWEWTGANNGNGYGRTGYQGKLRYVHQLVWEATVGPVPEHMELDHLCRNTLCCNPDHLEPVTHQENLRRGIWGKRSPKTHCPQGHPYEGENVFYSKNGTVNCRSCKRRRNAAHMRHRRKQEKEITKCSQ